MDSWDIAGLDVEPHHPQVLKTDKEARVMWRTTVSGNPGAEYAGERKSWIAA